MGLFTLVSFAFVLGCLAGKFIEGSACDESFSYVDAQRGYLRRLDGASADGRVVFLGSSTLQGLDTSTVTPVGLNLSIGGDTLQGLGERSAGYRSLATARAVVVNIGLNDLMRDCASPALRIEDLLVLVPVGTPIILLGVQGVQMTEHSRRCDKELASLIDEFNYESQNSCRIRSNCQFIPNPVTTHMDQGAMKALQEPDGIHLSEHGYQALSSALRNALSKMAPDLATVQ